MITIVTPTLHAYLYGQDYFHKDTTVHTLELLPVDVIGA